MRHRTENWGLGKKLVAAAKAEIRFRTQLCDAAFFPINAIKTCGLVLHSKWLPWEPAVQKIGK